MGARHSYRLELPCVLSLNIKLVEARPFMAGQWCSRFSAPLHQDCLAARWAAGKGKQQNLTWREGAGDGCCALGLEDLGASG